MNRDKIGTQTCYIHQCTKRYVDVHSMSVSQSCLCSFLCNPYIHFKFLKFFIYLYNREFTHDTVGFGSYTNPILISYVYSRRLRSKTACIDLPLGIHPS